VSATVTGLVIANIGSICSAFNYLVAADFYVKTVYWSSTTTPTDFTVSLVTGAGNEIPGQLRSVIVMLVEHPIGFFIYSVNNVLAAKYTGNSRYPWKFVEISNSGGYRFGEQFFGTQNSDTHLGIDNSGKIQILRSEEAEVILPEITTFFERSRYFDVFNYSTNVFTIQEYEIETPTSAPALAYHNTRRIYFLLDRYVIISYGDLDNIGGTSQYKLCFIFDLVLKRYGKLKILHNYVFSSSSVIYFLDALTGTVVSMCTDIYDNTDFGISAAVFTGVLLLGKFQLVRDRFIQLEDIDIESAQDSTRVIAQNFSVFLLPTLDGKNFQASITPTEVASTGLIKRYVAHKTAKNWSIGIKGAFDINTLDLKIIPHGHV
jgi:hypothetical protein